MLVLAKYKHLNCTTHAIGVLAFPSASLRGASGQAAERYFIVKAFLVFALVEGKDEKRFNDEVPLCRLP